MQLFTPPEEDFTIPFGEANVVKEGSDVTIVGVGMGVHNGLKAAKLLEEKGVNAEVIDLRTLVPLDRDTVFNSVKKTGHLIVVDEDYQSYGLTGEIIATIAERDVTALKASPQRVAYPDIPIPFSRPMERYALPNPEKIVNAYTKMKEQ